MKNALEAAMQRTAHIPRENIHEEAARRGVSLCQLEEEQRFLNSPPDARPAALNESLKHREQLLAELEITDSQLDQAIDVLRRWELLVNQWRQYRQGMNRLTAWFAPLTADDASYIATCVGLLDHQADDVRFATMAQGLSDLAYCREARRIKPAVMEAAKAKLDRIEQEMQSFAKEHKMKKQLSEILSAASSADETQTD